jgi:hypothetical protein
VLHIVCNNKLQFKNPIFDRFIHLCYRPFWQIGISFQNNEVK